MEIERKFLCGALPFDLSGYPYQMLEQRYIALDPVIRIRRQDETFVLTVKGAGQIAREEFEIPITAQQYQGLLAKAEEGVVKKHRTTVPLDNQLFAEIDVYHGNLTGLCTVEVEFESIDAANRFTPPSWFGREVTEDSRYTNACLSQRGMPESELDN